MRACIRAQSIHAYDIQIINVANRQVEATGLLLGRNEVDEI